jgi:hypothetical protein
MFKEFFFSIATIGFILAASIISPLSDVKKKNFLHRDFVNRNFINDDQSTPNLYPLSFQSPNLHTKIEGMPIWETHPRENRGLIDLTTSQIPRAIRPKFLITVLPVLPNDDKLNPQNENEKSIYIVNQVRRINLNREIIRARISKVLHR